MLKKRSVQHSDEMCKLFRITDITWQGENIKVLKRILVRPPYTPDSVEIINDASDASAVQAREHVRKIVSHNFDSHFFNHFKPKFHTFLTVIRDLRQGCIGT